MKKNLFFLILTMIFAVSCGSSKKTENDADVLPDEDVNDVDETDDNEDEEAVKPDKESDKEQNDNDEWEIETDDGIPCKENPCENFANTNGKCSGREDGSFECGCVDGYFWGYLGCKKIAIANMCTGQDKCYSGDYHDLRPLHKCPREESVIYGQDAQYAEKGYCFERDFDVNRSVEGEPTHINKVLHLEWMQDNSNVTRIWEDAEKYCNDLNYGGHDDWRLPLPKELMTIVPRVEHSDNFSHLFWSSMTLAEDETSAWYLNTMFYINSTRKTSKLNVRCTRGDNTPFIESQPESGRFEIINMNGKDMIKDSQIGILWHADYSKEYDWIEALPYCERSEYAGFSDWRLPNIFELNSLLNYEYELISEFPLAEKISSEHNTSFWSSTTNDFYESPAAHGMDLKNGSNVTLLKDNAKARALCIRNEPCREGYWWNGAECVQNPCEKNPCKNMEHSDGTCGTEDFKSYFCNCTDGWFWDGSHCAVNPCKPNPCGNYENSTGECRSENSFTFICGCDEGYWWWGKNEGCLKERPHQARLCTGQTKCYDMEKEIECPAEGEEFYGQDAQYAALGRCVPQNFILDTVYEDEPLVIDVTTGLEWQQKVMPASQMSWYDVQRYCSNLDYSGYHDWRLPTSYELQTLISLGTSPTINLKYFPDTPPENFWTSSLSSYGSYDATNLVNFEKADPGDMMITDFITGESCRSLSSIRCVRGDIFEESSGNVYGVSYEDGKLYTNTTTNLIWYSVNLNYNDVNSWPERLQYCEDLDFAGFSDWRLPNIRELNSIAVDGAYLRYGSSSTTMPWHPAEHFGSLSYKDETSIHYVCVRENPCKNGKIWNHGECVGKCEEGYVWNEEELKCVFKVDRCDPNPCEGIENGTGECIQPGPYEQTCACIEGYKWDSVNDECVKNN